MRKQSHLTKSKRKSFGDYLRRTRIACEMPLRVAAESIGCISFSALAAIERGDSYKISMGFLRAVSEAYGVNYDALCIRAERVPQDVYYKLVRNPRLWDAVREME